jgi:hypothetical protein
VLSNFFLRPIDNLIAATGAEYRRYGDDMLIFSRDRSMGEAVAESLDDELRLLELTRSIEKKNSLMTQQLPEPTCRTPR